MKNQCILLSDCNFDLAYNLRQYCLKNNIELLLAKNIVEALNQTTITTKAIIIELKEKQYFDYLNYFDDSINYEVLFLINNELRNLNGEIAYLNFESFFKSQIFKDEYKCYAKKQIIEKIEDCFKNIGIVINTWQLRFIKEVLVYMIENNKQQINKKDIEFIAIGYNVSKNTIYTHIQKTLKPFFNSINKLSDIKLKKFNSKKILILLCSCVKMSLEKI